MPPIRPAVASGSVHVGSESGAAIENVGKDVVRFEDSGVVGEQVEHDPPQKALEVTAAMALRRRGHHEAGRQARRLGC